MQTGQETIRHGVAAFQSFTKDFCDWECCVYNTQVLLTLVHFVILLLRETLSWSWVSCVNIVRENVQEIDFHILYNFPASA